MPITVDLQDVYSYNKVAFIVAAVIFIALLVLGIIVLVKFLQSKTKPKAAPPPLVVKEPTALVKARIKNKYLGILTRLENDYKAGKLKDRTAFETLSRLIRKFVRETTGIKVTNYTLEEIKGLNLPKLSKAIELCYPPEFAYKAEADFMSTTSFARNVIQTWD